MDESLLLAMLLPVAIDRIVTLHMLQLQIIAAMIVFPGFLLTLLAQLGLQGRCAPQPGCRNRVILYSRCVDVRLLSYDGWATTVNLDELAPHFPLDRLVI